MLLLQLIFISSLYKAFKLIKLETSGWSQAHACSHSRMDALVHTRTQAFIQPGAHVCTSVSAAHAGTLTFAFTKKGHISRLRGK